MESVCSRGAFIVKMERIDHKITCANEVYETPIRFTLRKHNLSKPVESCFRLSARYYNTNFLIILYYHTNIPMAALIVS